MKRTKTHSTDQPYPREKSDDVLHQQLVEASCCDGLTSKASAKKLARHIQRFLATRPTAEFAPVRMLPSTEHIGEAHSVISRQFSLTTTMYAPTRNASYRGCELTLDPTTSSAVLSVVASGMNLELDRPPLSELALSFALNTPGAHP